METYRTIINDPWFSSIKDGSKTVIAVVNNGKISKISKTDTLIVTKGGTTEVIRTAVQDTKKYPSYSDLLNAEGLNDVFPGVSITNVDEGVKLLREEDEEGEESEYGVLAIRLELKGPIDVSPNSNTESPAAVPMSPQEASFYRKYKKYKAKYLLLKSQQ